LQVLQDRRWLWTILSEQNRFIELDAVRELMADNANNSTPEGQVYERKNNMVGCSGICVYDCISDGS
jgi:hypothetical protein